MSNEKKILRSMIIVENNTSTKDEPVSNKREQLVEEEQQRVNKKIRIDLNAHVLDLSKDYLDHFNDWRKTKKRLIHLYYDTAIINNKMVCDNCKKIVKVNMEIAQDTHENPHVTVNEDKTITYKCNNVSFTEYFQSLQNK